MDKIAVIPGSFDPITIGHVDIIKRSMHLFDKIIIAFGINTRKKYYFSLEQRKQWVREIFSAYPSVEVKEYKGLTVDFCRAEQANYIIRGIRSAADFEYEKTIAQLNHSMDEKLETLLILSRPEFSHISSTIVREIMMGKGNYKPFVPPEVKLEEINPDDLPG